MGDSRADSKAAPGDDISPDQWGSSAYSVKEQNAASLTEKTENTVDTVDQESVLFEANLGEHFTEISA